MIQSSIIKEQNKDRQGPNGKHKTIPVDNSVTCLWKCEWREREGDGVMSADDDDSFFGA